jgi:GDP-D-mannose 3',5'-epimerase
MGVAGRNSDNTMIEKITGWKPKYSLKQGLEKTYEWINSQMK